MEFNDYELIYMAKENNEDAINCLRKKYKPILKKKASEYYLVCKNKGVEYNDFYQEAMLGLEDAIYCFDPNSDTLFYTFVNVCVDRQLNNILAKLNRTKHKILNEAISLDYTYEDNFSINNYIKEDKVNPEELLINEDAESKLYNKIVNKLTANEKDVLDLKIKGFDYLEIANILNKEPKAISNTLYRIKIKVKEILNKDK